MNVLLNSNKLLYLALNNNINDTICRIIPRSIWQALDPPPEGFEQISEPVDIVIICKLECICREIL